MQKGNYTKEQSIQDNLDTWCFEVGSRFEKSSIHAARVLSTLVFWHDVVDIGAGDGAGSLALYECGLNVTANDINLEKLLKIQEKNNLIKIKCLPASDYLKSIEEAANIFSHHSLEHMIDAEEVISLCGQKLRKGGYYLMIVPADDYLHSVHHVVFENEEELLPEGLEPILLAKQNRFGEEEFVCIATKK